MKKELLYSYFSDDDFLAISEKISQMEKLTAGEIRVSIKEKKPLLKQRKDIRLLAEEEFYKLKIDNTRDKTGILLFILLKEKQFYILADEGINSKVQQETWNRLSSKLSNSFKLGHFLEGVLETVDSIGNILAEHFPIKDDDTNELSNKVAL